MTFRDTQQLEHDMMEYVCNVMIPVKILITKTINHASEWIFLLKQRITYIELLCTSFSDLTAIVKEFNEFSKFYKSNDA